MLTSHQLLDAPLTYADYKAIWQHVARQRLIEFTLYTKPDYLAGWFHHRLARRLDQFLADVVAKKSPRLMVFAPPRSGKSELVSRRFPAYALGRYPDMTFIATSYANDLASSINRDVQRVIDSPEYGQLFPGTSLFGKNIRTTAYGSYLRNSDIFEIVNHRGAYKSAGVGAGVTGRGGECFPAGTLVATNAGPVCIENLNHCTSTVKVLSFKQGVGLEWKSLEGWRRVQAAGLYRVTTASGRVVEATADHPFYTGHGYVKARDLAPGDSLLLAVPEELQHTGLRLPEESAQGPCGSLLFSRVLDAAPRGEEQPHLPGVWSAGGAAPYALPTALRSEVHAQAAGLPACDDRMPNMQHGVPGEVEGQRQMQRRVCDLLFQGVRGTWSLAENVGRGQSEVEEWCVPSASAAALCEGLSGDATEDIGARWPSLRGVQAVGHSAGGASHRQQPNEQRSIQSGNAVLEVPSSMACSTGFQTINDVVAMVEEVCTPACVYDLQVADNHNFFANGILVHNCLLIDDPVKDASEAHSETVRNSVWEWYTSTLYTRAAPGGGIMLIMTRWHEDDLAGRILENMKHSGEQWEVIKFPAIAENDEYDETGKLLRREGEALHPERFTVDMLNKIRLGTSSEAGVGSRVWASLYQQRPSAAEGNIFKREYWRFVRSPYGLPMEMTYTDRKMYFHELGINRIIQRWDTALGEKKQSDYSACVTLGIAKSRYYVLDVYKCKLEFPELKRQVQVQYDKWRPAKVIVEGGGSASGKATVQAMRKDSRVPIHECITATDKVLRADAVSPHLEAGLVSFFEGDGFVADFIEQCANFPSIKNDDDVDAFIGALEEAIKHGGAMEISDDLLRAVGAM